MRRNISFAASLQKTRENPWSARAHHRTSLKSLAYSDRAGGEGHDALSRNPTPPSVRADEALSLKGMECKVGDLYVGC